MTGPTIPALLTTDAGGELTLRAPKVGLWSDPPRDGAIVTPGATLGTIVQLNRRFALVVPDGVAGRVELAGGTHDTRLVAYGDVLCRVMAVASLGAGAAASRVASPGAGGNDLAMTSPTDGVFYRSPSTGARPYVAAGDRIAVGQPIGLIEVMKTFNPIAYGGSGLPEEAEIVAVLVADGAEVRAGQPLVAVKTL